MATELEGGRDRIWIPLTPESICSAPTLPHQCNILDTPGLSSPRGLPGQHPHPTSSALNCILSCVFSEPFTKLSPNKDCTFLEGRVHGLLIFIPSAPTKESEKELTGCWNKRYLGKMPELNIYYPHAKSNRFILSFYTTGITSYSFYNADSLYTGISHFIVL